MWPRSHLRRYGIRIEAWCGTPGTRPGARLSEARDQLAIWKFDRPTLIELVPNLEQHGIKLVPLQESIDTLTPAGKALIQIYDVF